MGHDNRGGYSQRGGGYGNNDVAIALSPEVKTKIVAFIGKTDAKTMNDVAESRAKELTAMSTSKIRNFLETLQLSGEDYDQDKLYLLKYKLAYAVGKEKDSKQKAPIRHFYELIDCGMSAVKDKGSFVNFTHFVEALVAYHRFHGGRE
jgi:CRISPR-associated protein Csm2